MGKKEQSFDMDRELKELLLFYKNNGGKKKDFQNIKMYFIGMSISKELIDKISKSDVIEKKIKNLQRKKTVFDMVKLLED